MADANPPVKKDFFISYNQADDAWAKWIAWYLAKLGHYVAIQPWNFNLGSNSVVEIDCAIEESERAIVVISPDYLTSINSHPQWATSFLQRTGDQNRRLIGVRVRECEPKSLFGENVVIDLVGKREDEAKAALLDAVKLGRHKPKNRLSFLRRKVRNQPRFPGNVPEVWNVPHRRNPNFIEPSHLLTEIRDALHSGAPTVLTGLAGVGKTQIAVEYAYRYSADYGLIWWMRSQEQATQAIDYASLATALDLPEKDLPAEEIIINAVHEALKHRSNWLLIFDDADRAKIFRTPPASGGHVLVTSREAPSFYQTIPIGKWPSELAVEFLLTRTGQKDSAAALELARKLDYLPLAMEQAVSYVNSARTTLAGYLLAFHELHIEPLQLGEVGTDFLDYVATTFELSFRRVQAESPSAALLLQLCAFLAPVDISYDLVAAGAEHLPEPLRETASDSIAFDNVVRTLVSYSLVEVGKESTLSIQELVRARIRARLDRSATLHWAEISERLVITAGRLEKHAASLPLFFDAACYTAAEIAELLGYFSDYYEALTGDRLVIDSHGALEPSPVQVF